MGQYTFTAADAQRVERVASHFGVADDIIVADPSVTMENSAIDTIGNAFRAIGEAIGGTVRPSADQTDTPDRDAALSALYGLDIEAVANDKVGRHFASTGAMFEAIASFGDVADELLAHFEAGLEAGAHAALEKHIKRARKPAKQHASAEMAGF